MTKNSFLFLFLSVFSPAVFAQTSTLSVEKIMQDPLWMGTFPSSIKWGENSENIYFLYNPEKNRDDSLYRINIKTPTNIVSVSTSEKKALIPHNGDYNKDRTLKVYTKRNALYIYDLKKKTETALVQLATSITSPVFLADGKRIGLISNNNTFIYDTGAGTLAKITNIKEGEESKKKEDTPSEKAAWIREDNLNLLHVVKEREDKKESSKAYKKLTEEKDPYKFFSGKKSISSMRVSPDGRYVTFNLMSRDTGDRTIVPDFIDASGYTTDLRTRTKVGDEKSTIESAIYNVEKDTVYLIQTSSLPGIKDLPDYIADYPEREWKEKVRELQVSRAYFSDNGEHAFVTVRSKDNKDRWIAKVDLSNGRLQNLDRQRDEAWIAGPGIGWSMGGSTVGWLPDNRHIYFQSEATGYSHLYILDVLNGNKKALTSGDFEVFDPFISKDKKHWYLTTSEVHSGERHFYKRPLFGGNMEKLTSLTGNNEVSLSPDEKHLAILHSYSNKPWELYLKENKVRSAERQLTSGQSEEFKQYPWRDPQLVNFTAADGTSVPARLYTPEPSVKNGAAIVFVHGAGYLQNVHKWWSLYFREYMFHNLLTDLGYTVIDIDYRGSAGYGRDWRTGIYRHMGGKDLSDQIDGAKYLVEEHGIDKEKIGIYGGSYGGFITLMAMFNEPGTFASGAALRSVTDWAHYNHGYTSNILNEPVNDPIAYRRSSPIYFAEGLEGHLLIAHGMVDINVHFQDVVRLAQRLIELEKDNWEMALYPAEDHGFTEPSSWIDEYKRILKLFNNTLIDK